VLNFVRLCLAVRCMVAATTTTAAAAAATPAVQLRDPDLQQASNSLPLQVSLLVGLHQCACEWFAAPQQQQGVKTVSTQMVPSVPQSGVCVSLFCHPDTSTTVAYLLSSLRFANAHSNNSSCYSTITPPPPPPPKHTHTHFLLYCCCGFCLPVSCLVSSSCIKPCRSTLACTLPH
jgi:hypothetical protein